MSKGGCAGINKCNADILVFLMSTIVGDLIYRPFFPSQYQFQCAGVLSYVHHLEYDVNSIIIEFVFLLFTSIFKGTCNLYQ